MTGKLRIKTRTQSEKKGSIADPILSLAASACKHILRKWASQMARKTQNMTRKKLLLLLLIFILSFGGYSGYLFATSLSGRHNNIIRMTSIKSPRRILQPEESARHPKPVVSKMLYKRVIHFQKYLDSLARSPSGKTRYDSILVCRPGLPDSIRQIEKLYRLQFNH